MNRHGVSDQDLAALGTFQGKIERSASFLAQAQNHNLGRNVRVVKVLAALDLMRKAGENMAGAVTCAAAIRQNFSSSNPMQAAHFLPGQLRIGARPIWELTRSPRARAKVEFWFAEVEHLPAPFNHADSEAEASGATRGLCTALSAAVTILLRPQSGLSPIQLAYQEWQRLALDALQSAQDNKGAKPGVPPLVGNAIDGYTMESIAARGQVSSTEWNRSEATRILGYYLADQRQRTWGWVTGGCQPALREVEQLFK
jgi:hypothetical protein